MENGDHFASASMCIYTESQLQTHKFDIMSGDVLAI